MGCFESKAIVDGKANSKNSIGEQSQLRVTASSMVSQKAGDINKFYKILYPELGSGSFGKVCKGLHISTGIIRAIKMILKSNTSPEEKQRIINEVNILKNLDHPNIIRVYEYFEDAKLIYIVTDLCTGGELYDKIIDLKRFTEQDGKNVMRQLLSGIAYCHAKNIVHRDIKPENLLYESKKQDSNIKIIDFGISSKFQTKSKLSERIGTLYYLAPEVLSRNYDQKCDLWSAGVIMYVLFAGYPPFSGKSDKEITDKIQNKNVIYDTHDFAGLSESGLRFLKKLLVKDPQQRMTAQEALKDDWFISEHVVDLNDANIASNLTNLKNFRNENKLNDAVWSYLVSFLSTSEERNEMLSTFQAIDKNGDGQLSRDELIEGYKKILGKENVEHEVDAILAAVDTDNSGFIDYSGWHLFAKIEFIEATCSKQKFLSDEKLETAFNLFDTDKSGTISIVEIKEIFAPSIGNNINANFWEELIKEADENGDGEISLQEFKVMMTKLMK